MQVRLAGEGERSPQGGPPGDCFCVIRVRKHPIFERDGQNLFLQMPITYTQAALGADVDVPTMHGPRSMKIPKGTPTGHVFRLTREGVPHPQGGPAGDLLIRVFVEVPNTITRKQEKILRELAELEHTEVAPARKSFLERLRSYFVDDQSETQT
jgi:molecular chaperone DnaJ